MVAVRLRKQVYKKCEGHCAYCGKELEFSQMEVDHLEPIYRKLDDAECVRQNILRGADHIENLMPSCKRCNKWKSDYPIADFRAQIIDQHNKLLRDAPGYKLARDYGMIVEVVWDGRFYYQRMDGFSASYKRTTG